MTQSDAASHHPLYDYCRISNKSRTKSQNLKIFSYRLAVIFAESIEAKF